MALTTTLTSLSSSRASLKDLCCICEAQPFDLICTCGDKFDFNCIHQHVEQIGLELQDQYEEVSEKFTQIHDLHEKENKHFDATRAVIDNWKRARVRDIDEIAEKVLRDVQQRQSTITDVSSLQSTYDEVSANLHRVVHDNLNKVIELNQQVQIKIDEIQNVSVMDISDGSLDALLQSKLQPSVLNTNVPSPSSSSSMSNTNNHRDLIRNEREPVLSLRSFSPIFNRRTSSNVERTESNTDTLASAVSVVPNADTLPPAAPVVPDVDILSPEAPHTDVSAPIPSSTDVSASAAPNTDVSAPASSDIDTQTRTEPTTELTNTINGNDASNESINHDEFDAGYTRHIQRPPVVTIPTNNDRFAGAICCHDNQLLYNSYSPATETHRLVLIHDVADPTEKQAVDWNIPDDTVDAADDDWIQDIVYSDKLSGYLVLNRARLRLYKADTNQLEEFRTFRDHTMKRLSCNGMFIYLTANSDGTVYNGDEIIIMNYDKQEQACKTFRDILPSRANRGSVPLAGQISDIAAGANDQVTIGYRLERRKEVGVCVFNLTNNGREWSCVKQLSLNDCWHQDLSYTPRIEWCEKLNIYILIEYMTAHLIMIDSDGQVEGECRFMQGRDRRESSINLTVSTNDWLCTRCESVITIHKITS